MKKAIPVLVLLSITNGIGIALYIFRYKLFPQVNFVDHLDGLGSALASYATAMMALVFALIVILTSLDNENIRKFKAFGYLKSTYFFYFFCFIELGITLFLAILCLSNIKTYFIASLALTFSVVTFLQVMIVVLQVILLSLKR
ncbi:MULTISPECIES: hypothetical protein [Enterobacter]|uniref:hypothetical protein n=1 Tax=Enterobacter TaxID=547 RepID=UPI0021DA6612|nr:MULTISPECIES: hypothetical protein [Enterobacter]MDZ5701884.1 hypothetical protein [Enterobacter ludwigii]